jgi:SOS-response transcriptional repressor LexA
MRVIRRLNTRLDEVRYSMEAVIRRIPIVLNVTGEITIDEMDKEAGFIILVPHNAAIATITTIPVD